MKGSTEKRRSVRGLRESGAALREAKCRPERGVAKKKRAGHHLPDEEERPKPRAIQVERLASAVMRRAGCGVGDVQMV
jgi:hypothetical protein